MTAARAVLAEIGADGAVSLDRLSATETVAVLSRLQELSGAVAAVQARALIRLEESVKEDCRRREETPKQALKIARSEVSTALKQSRSCAGQSMASCRRLVRSMPGMLAALAHGRIVPSSAHRVGRTMAPASPEQRAQVDQILAAHLPYLEDCGPEEWAGEAEKVLHGLDPHGAADRHRTAKKDRSVTVRRGEHGMCTVTAHLSGLDGARIRKGLSIAAEKARAHGDRRGHQQIMADLFADALIGRGEGIDPSTLDIGVIITDRSLLAPDHADAATIEGYGAVPYEHIREEMREAMSAADQDPELAPALRRLYTDPEDGQLVAVESTARSFPPALARFLRIAHQTCRAPHCDASIRQNDHIVPWAQGGPTSLDNGNGLCAADNQKEESGQSARVVRDENGKRRTVEWTTRYGQKSHRRGINHDPLGTGARLLGSTAGAEHSALDADSGPPQDEPTPGTSRESGIPRRDHSGDQIQGTAVDEPEGALRRALALIDPHLVEHDSLSDRHRLARGRRDHVFLPHLTLISRRPWRGPEAGAA
ncbi:HNH endonuclease signature motif containing protein [Brachybacterium vulturis]|uniref:HNH endonuclease signature motif containing protein n=1 Tax=Brachybacterium vulturis TaxID=2017484 RepID=UPI001FEB3EF3|nr:HNH endonuclease signature motif containing protein [Brachybacterium vulturis]